MCRRALWFQRDGGSHDFVVSAARMITTRANLQAAETLSEAVGDRFFEDRYAAQPALGGATEFFWRYMQAGTIVSGTTEMLQRQLARAMFGGERTRVTEDAVEIRWTVDRFAAALGSVDLARRCMVEPALRRQAADGLLAIIADLDPRAGQVEGLAAAEVCRAAGHAVLPLPVESMLLRAAGTATPSSCSRATAGSNTATSSRRGRPCPPTETCRKWREPGRGSGPRWDRSSTRWRRTARAPLPRSRHPTQRFSTPSPRGT